MTELLPNAYRSARPPVPLTNGVRVVATADLKRLHRLLLAIFAMEAIDLAMGLFKLWR